MAEENKLRVEAASDKVCGTYANASIVSTTGAESRIDFLYVDRVNKDESGVPAYLVSRIIMPTSELSNLSETLTKHISKHLEKGM